MIFFLFLNFVITLTSVELAVLSNNEYINKINIQRDNFLSHIDECSEIRLDNVKAVVDLKLPSSIPRVKISAHGELLVDKN